MVTSAELKSATRDGVNLAYLDTGSGEPALVFIHGWCCNQTMWGEQTKAFAPKHRVIAVDLAGHGRVRQAGPRLRHRRLRRGRRVAPRPDRDRTASPHRP